MIAGEHIDRRRGLDERRHDVVLAARAAFFAAAAIAARSTGKRFTPGSLFDGISATK
jgi:hypothetical protein